MFVSASLRRARKLGLVCGWLVLPAIAAAQSDSAGPAAKVFTGATVITRHGAPPLADARLVVRGDRILCISGPEGCQVTEGPEIALEGKWVGPGLIDSHVHLELERAPKKALDDQLVRFAMGITTTRDAGTEALDALLEERQRAEDPSLPVPRLLVTSRVTDELAMRFETAGPAGLVGRLAELGVDGIKLKDPTDPADMVEVIRAARSLGLTVSGHTWNGPPPRVMTAEAIAAGVDGIVHLGSFAPSVLPAEVKEDFPDPSTGGFYRWRKELWVQVDPARLDPLLSSMVAEEVWLEPTLTFEYYFGRRPPAPPDMPFLAGSTPSAREWLKRMFDRSPTDAPRYPAAYAQMEATVRRFHSLGGMLVAGSDGVSAGLDLHLEIELLENAGLSSDEAMAAATHNAALAVGRLEDRGTLEVGKLADFVVYDVDPRASPEHRRDIAQVVKGGYAHDARALLDEASREWRRRSRAVWRARFFKLVVLGLVLLGGSWLALIALRRARSR